MDKEGIITRMLDNTGRFHEGKSLLTGQAVIY